MAGIKTWILTGDNLETTLGLCHKLLLIGKGSPTRVMFKLSDPEEISEENFVTLNSKISKLKKGRNFGLAINGEYFNKVMSYEFTNKLLFKQFVDIILRCEIAILGEMRPNQKREIVKIIKDAHPNKITLAVGDGMNDIPMLVEAHVGIAILRNRTYSLCKFSDYYVQSFSELKLLLFFFGRECYRKNCKLLLYMFFKNLLYVLSDFWAGTLNFYSGIILKPSLVSNSFSLFLTAFPMVFYGIYDKIYSKQEMLFSPLFYETGKKRLFLNNKIFVHEMVIGIIFSCYLTYLCLLLFDWGNYKDGVFYGWYNFGNMLSMGVVITVNLRIFLMANAFSIWNFIVIWISIGSFFGIWYLQNIIKGDNIEGSFFLILRSYQFYIFIVYNIAISIIEYMIIKLEFYEVDKKYIPDFDVKFDAANKGDTGNVKIEYSGVSNKEIKVKGLRHGSNEKNNENSGSESESYSSDEDSEQENINNKVQRSKVINSK
jgi:phospholipid-transporting ATPase